MDSQKYLIIITLIDGQNFTVPDGAPDKIEATVFAEARFGNEFLRSDPIKLINSNPEFVTELAWQLDKKNLHQLRVERKSIKLQVFMQTRERKKLTGKSNNNNNKQQSSTNGTQSLAQPSPETNKIELIGYTIIDIRSAQQKQNPKFRWLPLLNPKFRKPSYNRPEVQLALTLSRVDENDENENSENTNSSLLVDQGSAEGDDSHIEFNDDHINCELEIDSDDTRLFTTCLDTTNSGKQNSDAILDNDIIIRSKDGCIYIYDAKSPDKSNISDCVSKYRLKVAIPFSSGLETLKAGGGGEEEEYYYTINLFGASHTVNGCSRGSGSDIEELELTLFITEPEILAKYFELNSNLDIRLLHRSGQPVGIATIQLDQLCGIKSHVRTIEGIFALQPISESDYDIPSGSQPSIGVSIFLEKVKDTVNQQQTKQAPDPQLRIDISKHIELAKDHFGENIDDYLFREVTNDTHQVTLEDDEQGLSRDIRQTDIMQEPCSSEDDHHFCFTIDLKEFSYTPSQRLIPTLRELVVRYSYPFFGYQDTISTDASVPINSTNSIIVSGFCEFNFATTSASLLAALETIPLNLEVLACDAAKLRGLDNEHSERTVATCEVSLANTLGLNQDTIVNLYNEPLSKTISAPIHALDGEEIGELQIYLCLKDLGKPSYNFKSTSSIENLQDLKQPALDKKATTNSPSHIDHKKLDAFIAETRANFEDWKEEFKNKLTEDIRRSNSERLRRMFQRIEAKEAKRDQEFKKKMDTMNNLEKKLKASLACVDTMERALAASFEQFKIKDSMLDTRLDTMDLKISQAINTINSKTKTPETRPTLNSEQVRSQHSFDDNLLDTRQLAKKASRNAFELNGNEGTRRSSLKNVAKIPIPVRSSSLVRRPSEGSSSTPTRVVRRTTGVTNATSINGNPIRGRSNSTRLNLSKELQEKLANLRKEKAELLKKGCKPNDELIQEINSLIEKLVC